MTTAVRVSSTSMKVQNIHSNRTGITRKKWGLDEELLLLRLFKIYKRSWDHYVAYYPGRNTASIKNKYYTLARRGDAYNRAIYGTVALDDKNLNAPLTPQYTKPSSISAKKERRSSENVLDLSVINCKNTISRDDLTNSTPHCLTPDATNAFVGSEFNINGGASGILLGTDYRDTVSLGQIPSDDGVATPSLLTDSTFLADNCSIDDYIQPQNNTNPPIIHDVYPIVRPNADRPMPYDYPHHPYTLGESRLSNQNPLNFMFTLPFNATPSKSPHPLITHTYPVLPPMFQHNPVQSFQHAYPFGMLSPVGFPFNM